MSNQYKQSTIMLPPQQTFPIDNEQVFYSYKKPKQQKAKQPTHARKHQLLTGPRVILKQRTGSTADIVHDEVATQ